MHGGDIYRNSIHFDFSVNTNPLGVPSEVQWVLTEAALHAVRYPDISHERLIGETAKIFDVLEDMVVYGNGASEIIMAICHAIMPKKAMLIAPCFSGYEYCLTGACGKCDIVYHELKEADSFRLTDDIIDAIKSEKPKVLFLTNPNNPNGLLVEKDLLERIILACESVGCTVILDECFITLTGREKELSLAYNIRKYKSLVVLRAFTKTFAIPGVRLGYAICSKKILADSIKAHLPEWNLSIFAQMAGAECLKHTDYISDSVRTINAERKYLTEALALLGLKVYPTDANYILFKTEKKDLAQRLLEYNILIRDCSDYIGLGEGYYRVAIKLNNENSGLISAIENILND
ncbi:histidinol-phosphate aminotransferase [Pseudobutyrivibrio sp. OR37]|uniref:pyridoxal phosphate-dependent aminotransferase n=1 Tax=Pseudobutyrivibrio sp. OR37 TaxID=1798186 RepID=UPI0008ED8473|nr:histidinol-phosphate transaminase [Pseudobutyrivibrio sp. OR37]SFH53647.1 histidinol-phosphate aminotransferase [Pseudobutyrivibrio sp. OR37]